MDARIDTSPGPDSATASGDTLSWPTTFAPATSFGFSATQTLTVSDILARVRERWLLAATCVVLGVVGSIGYTLTAPTSYVASASVVVQPVIAEQFGSVNLSSVINMLTESQVARSSAVATAAGEKLNLSPDVVRDALTVDSPQDTQVLNLHFAAGTPDGAAAGAQTVAESYLAYREGSAQADADRRLASITAQIETVTQRIGQGGQTSAYQETLRSLLTDQRELTSIKATSGGRVITRAVPPTVKSSPRPVVDVAIGLAGGLIAGLILSVMLPRRRSRDSAVVRDRRMPVNPPAPLPVAWAPMPESQPDAQPDAKQDAKPDALTEPATPVSRGSGAPGGRDQDGDEKPSAEHPAAEKDVATDTDTSTDADVEAKAEDADAEVDADAEDSPEDAEVTAEKSADADADADAEADAEAELDDEPSAESAASDPSRPGETPSGSSATPGPAPTRPAPPPTERPATPGQVPGSRGPVKGIPTAPVPSPSPQPARGFGVSANGSHRNPATAAPTPGTGTSPYPSRRSIRPQAGPPLPAPTKPWYES